MPTLRSTRYATYPHGFSFFSLNEGREGGLRGTRLQLINILNTVTLYFRSESVYLTKHEKQRPSVDSRCQAPSAHRNSSAIVSCR